MFFYNPKSNKLICQTDYEKKSIVAWVDKSFLIHLRVYKMEQLRDFFDRLPTKYSKIIYDLDQGCSWVEYEGEQGTSCRQLEDHIRNFTWTDEEEYAIVYKRPLGGFKSFSLPKPIAQDQYLCIKGMGVSKIIANVQSGVVEDAQGTQMSKCIEHFKQLNKQQ